MGRRASFCLVAKVPIVSWLHFVYLCQAILWAPFRKLVILAPRLLDQCHHFHCPPFYAGGTICMKIGVGDIPFPVTRLSFLS